MAEATAKNFKRMVTDFQRDIDNQFSEEVKAFVRICYARMVRATPIDTGVMRASWIISVNGSGGGTRKPTPRPSGMPSNYKPPLSGRERQYLHIKLKRINTSKPFYIELYNVCDYFDYVYNGTSRMAPNGAMRTAALQIETDIRRAEIVNFSLSL